MHLSALFSNVKTLKSSNSLPFSKAGYVLLYSECWNTFINFLCYLQKEIKLISSLWRRWTKKFLGLLAKLMKVKAYFPTRKRESDCQVNHHIVEENFWNVCKKWWTFLSSRFESHLITCIQSLSIQQIRIKIFILIRQSKKLLHFAIWWKCCK